MFLFQPKAEESVLAYLLGKAYQWACRFSDKYCATYDELLHLPAIGGNEQTLNNILEKFMHPEELLVLSSGSGYCINPFKIKDSVKMIEDYLVTTGQLEK